jgi:SAM-dependent methyltransferase
MDSTLRDVSVSAVPDARPRRRSLRTELAGLARTFLTVTAAFCVIALALTLQWFPYQTDAVEERHVPPPQDYSAFYARIYSAPAGTLTNAEAAEEDDRYVSIARQAIEQYRIVPRVREFVAQYGLQRARVLDVGSGTGYLQDVVENYVGLDISPTASRYYHKPFVQASATEMPFPDNEFDAAWSIWVLEHVPQPERALAEIRRVVKDGGMLYLNPAWHCSPYFAGGYPVRPFRDLDWTGKLHKAAFYLQDVAPLPQLVQTFTRAALWFHSWHGGPTRLHYRPLEPNYHEYWMPDSDAVNWLDRYEMALWFTSRGDECLNCQDRFTNVWDELVIRVHKP